MPISVSSKISAARSAFSASVDDDLILFDPDNGEYFGSGPVGARIWTLISKGATVSDICNTLTQEYEVDHDVCEQEVLDFVTSLNERGLVTISE